MVDTWDGMSDSVALKDVWYIACASTVLCSFVRDRELFMLDVSSWYGVHELASWTGNETTWYTDTFGVTTDYRLPRPRRACGCASCSVDNCLARNVCAYTREADCSFRSTVWSFDFDTPWSCDDSSEAYCKLLTLDFLLPCALLACALLGLDFPFSLCGVSCPGVVVGTGVGICPVGVFLVDTVVSNL